MGTIIDVVKLKKLLHESEEELTNNISDKVSSFIRDNYIHKADYENRLKADKVTMLEDIKKEMNPIKECEYQIYGKEHWNFAGKCQDVIQQKIDALGGNDGL